MRLFLSLLILIHSFGLLNAQIELRGTVSDQDGNPLPAALVSIGNQGIGSLTNESGEYKIELKRPGKYALQVTYLGYLDHAEILDLSQNLELDIRMQAEAILNDEVMIRALRNNEPANGNSTTLDRAEIERLNLGPDLPYLLERSPSIVINSDAGAGIGYTSMRIRGSDQSRINVTLNGVPVNDPESHGVFWVNLPDLASSAENIQIQRGLGSSTNGAGAFGGSVNIQSSSLNTKAFAELNSSAGSFNSFKNNLRFGTGLLGDHFAFEGRLSRITSDGYIDRAHSDLKSFQLSGAYYDEKTIIRANVLSGRERTYQAWYGVPVDSLETNRRFNPSGTDFGFKSGDPYEDEVDDYGQDYYQLLVSRKLNDVLILNLGLFYTRGKGYFEQYKVGQYLPAYGLEPVFSATDTTNYTDLIRRLWLDNHHVGATYSLLIEPRSNWSFRLGGAYAQYSGNHYGELIWAAFSGSNEHKTNYYDNESLKTDFNIYGKFNLRPMDDLDLFLDLQYRTLGYSLGGIEENQILFNEDLDYHFFNPKFGFNYRSSDRSYVHASFGMGHREPTRQDIVNARTRQTKAEKLYDLELGYGYGTGSLKLDLNYFLMYYRDQLVLSGEVNEVGGLIRENVSRSYRTGLEIGGSWEKNRFRADANVSWSLNQILDYTEVVNTYDETYTLVDSLALSIKHGSTDISFSPDWVANLDLSYEVVKGLEISLLNKAVSRQFLDNSMQESRSLDPYLITDLLFRYSVTIGPMKELNLSFKINNLTNRLYSSSGYSFSERYTGPDGSGGSYLTGVSSYNYHFPQAGTHIMAGIGLKF